MGEVDDQLATVLTRLALALLNESSLTDDLERIACTAHDVIPNCSGASVALLVDGTPTTLSVSQRVALELDMVQYHAAEGPCLTALGGEAIRVGLLLEDERFPHFAVGAADQRIQSVLSMPILDAAVVVGTLNLYSRAAHAFDDAAELAARVLTAEAAHAIARSRFYAEASGARADIQRHYDEDAVVSMAEGVLMALQRCSAEQARALVLDAARHNREPLIDAAERILASCTDS
jgi:GAF domain-containing protein